MAELFSSLANAAKNLTQNSDIRQFTDKVTGMVMNLSPCEQAVWDATNEEPWGPTGPQMKEICTYTYQYNEFYGVMNLLYKRLLEDNKNAWRRVYKSLVLLDYLIKKGSERVVSSAKENMFHMRSLEHFKFIDAKGKDQGINVRHRATLILGMLQDDDKLRAERKKAKTDSKSYQGYTADDIRMGRGGMSNSSSDNFKSDSFKKYDTRKYSWEEENGKKDEDFSGPREVNAFKFPEDRRDSNSPELGFRDDIQNPSRGEDDDEFGDFASARSGCAQSAASMNAPSTTTPPKLAGPPAGSLSKFPTTAASKPAAPAVDLLGGFDDLAISAPAPIQQASPSAGLDLFGNVAVAPATSQPAFDPFGGSLVSPPPSATVATSVVRPPRPPSGGAAAPNQQPAVANDNALLGDLFSAAPSVTPVSSTPMSPANDLLSGWGAPVQPTASASVGDFGAFAQSTPTPAIPSSASMDFFSNGPVQSYAPATTGGVKAAASSASPKTAAPAKLGSTWAGATGLIDLDNLGGKKQTKQAVPMNRMMAPKTNTSQSAAPSSQDLPW